MDTQTQAEEFIENSRPAIEHLFSALNEYNAALRKAQTTAEEIENSKQCLSDLFMYRDQWSSNANHHYAQYIMRLETLEKQKKEAQEDDDKRLENALSSIGSTVESMSSLAGTILQIGKQSLSIRYPSATPGRSPRKPNLPSTKMIGNQSIVDVIWEGRNHSMHWEEGTPRQNVQDMLDALSNDLNIAIAIGKNNCLSIIGALGWKTADSVIVDLHALVQETN